MEIQVNKFITKLVAVLILAVPVTAMAQTKPNNGKSDCIQVLPDKCIKPSQFVFLWVGDDGQPWKNNRGQGIVFVSKDSCEFSKYSGHSCLTMSAGEAKKSNFAWSY